MISIVIPTLNEASVLETSLHALKRLAIPHEVIVSDGGSTDGTLEIAKRFADKVVTAKPGERQTIAIGRNAGAAVATGDILFHTDADVRIPNPDHFFNEVLEAFENPAVLGVTTRLRIYPEQERIDDRIVHFIFNVSIHGSMLFGSFLAKGECQFVRNDSFKKIGGYSEHIVAGEDGDMFRKLAKIGKIAYLGDLVVYHSPRRFRNQGYMKTLLIYGREGWSLFFRGKSYLSEWKQER